MSYFLPIHWARAHPHERTTISTQLLVLGSIVTTLAFPLAFGFGQNKLTLYIFAGIGVVIGFIFRVMLVETLTHIVNGQ